MLAVERGIWGWGWQNVPPSNRLRDGGAIVAKFGRAEGKVNASYGTTEHFRY